MFFKHFLFGSQIKKNYFLPFSRVSSLLDHQSSFHFLDFGRMSFISVCEILFRLNKSTVNLAWTVATLKAERSVSIGFLWHFSHWMWIWRNTVVFLVSPISPMLPTGGLSVDDLDPFSPAELRAAGGVLMLLGWGSSSGGKWSSESTSCCRSGSFWVSGLWQLAGCPLEDAAVRLGNSGWKRYSIYWCYIWVRNLIY